MPEHKRPYTTGEIAGFCDVTINAVKKWIAAGKLDAFRTPGGHYRVKREDFISFAGRYRLDIKDRLFPDKKKVLVVDDEKEIVEYITGALAAMDDDYLVESARDGYDALIKVGDFKPELLILDIMMPNIDGIEVCRRIKGDEHTMDIKILAVTAYGREDMERILKSGADYCLSKPLKLKELQKYIKKLLK